MAMEPLTSAHWLHQRATPVLASNAQAQALQVPLTKTGPLQTAGAPLMLPPKVCCQSLCAGSGVKCVEFARAALKIGDAPCNGGAEIHRTVAPPSI